MTALHKQTPTKEHAMIFIIILHVTLECKMLTDHQLIIVIITQPIIYSSMK